MKSKLLVALGVVSLFVISMSAFAHHGTQISYDMNKAIDVKGVVTKFTWLNPHSQLYFDVKDKDGKAIVNPVRTLNDDILENERTRAVMVIEYNVLSTVDIIRTTRLWDQTVNKYAWSLLGITTEPRAAVVREVSSSLLKTEGSYTYYTVTIRIAFADSGETWDEPVAQMGRHYFTKTNSSQIDEDPAHPGVYKRTAAPDLVPLNDDGTLLADTEPIKIKQWQTRRQEDFNQLPFMGLII